MNINLSFVDFRWWEKAKLLQYVDSQEELERYNKYLAKALKPLWIEPYWNTRKLVFLMRLWTTYFTFHSHFRFGFDFKFWLPGIEMKFACEAAEKVGAQLNFLGAEVNPVTYERLYHETRINLPYYGIKRFQYMLSPWSSELLANRQKLHQNGPRIFTEKCLDQHLINWYI